MRAEKCNNWTMGGQDRLLCVCVCVFSDCYDPVKRKYKIVLE